MQHSKKKYI